MLGTYKVVEAGTVVTVGSMVFANLLGGATYNLAMIPPDFIQQLLSRVDIVDVIDKHVKLKKAGQNYQACCPFHNENPELYRLADQTVYHCFGCGATPRLAS